MVGRLPDAGGWQLPDSLLRTTIQPFKILTTAFDIYIPNMVGDGIAKIIRIMVPVRVDPISRERILTPEAHELITKTKLLILLGRKLGHEEKADLLDWAETLLCNSLPMPHCSQEEWNKLITEWRNQKHGIKKNPDCRDTQSNHSKF